MLPSLAGSNNSAQLRGASESLQAAATSRSTSSLARVAELPALLLEAKARVAEVAFETRQLRAQLHSELERDTAQCRDMTLRLVQVLLEHKRDDQPRVLLAKSQWLAAFSRAMQRRAHVLAEQLVVETYPTASVSVLDAAQYVQPFTHCDNFTATCKATTCKATTCEATTCYGNLRGQLARTTTCKDNNLQATAH